MNTASATLGKFVAAVGLSCIALAPGGALAQTGTQAAPQSSRIAWLNPDRIFKESKAARLADEKLKEEFSGREKTLTDMANRLKAGSDRLEKGGASMAEAERAKLQRDLVDLNKDFERRQREFREDVAQRTNEERAALAEKATQIVKQLSLTEGFDLVVQDAVWVNPRIDITDKVLAALDKGK